MTVGVKKLRKIQMGYEDPAGTAVAATDLWRGTGVLEDQLEVVFPDEDIGLLAQADRAYIPKLAASITLEDTPLTFEQVLIPCLLGLADVESTQDGTGSDYIWEFPLGYDAASELDWQTVTVEGGDNQGVEEMEYGFASEITFKGTAGEAWMMGATLLGRQVTPSTFTGSIAVPAVEEALFSKTKLYIDDSGGTIGTTLKSNTLIDCEISIKTGLQPVWTADGELYFSFCKRVGPEITMTITFEHDTISVAEKVKWRAGATRLIKLICEGSQFATPGTTYTYHTFMIEMAGKWEKFDALDEVEGNDVVRGTFRVLYSSTDSEYFTVTVVNEEETML